MKAPKLQRVMLNIARDALYVALFVVWIARELLRLPGILPKAFGCVLNRIESLIFRVETELERPSPRPVSRSF